MGQVTSGLRAVLNLAPLYDLFQFLVGAQRLRRDFCERYVRAWPGASVLDIGCGTAAILDFLPPVRYHGFDASQQYVDAAISRYGSGAAFTCDTVTSKILSGLKKFDIVIAAGILHHLDDAEIEALLVLARDALAAGGRLVTIDGCYVEGQSRIARFLLSRDRGQNVRRTQEYERLARTVFDRVETSIRHDLLNIPYTHLIMECTA